MTPAGPIATLRRFAREAPTAAERCDGCAAVLPAAHVHRLRATGDLQCVCAACASAPGLGEVVARRVRLLPHPGGSDPWEALGLPIRLAFFVRHSEGAAPTAYFPSPAGTTASSLDPRDWAALCARIPSADAVRPDVEAVLVNRVAGARDQLVVSVDVCYHLVGTLRRHWRGSSGDIGPVLAEVMASLRREAADG